ncbi:enoyl-CoA hydratase/isomerase family protein [Aspergillus flavus]|nr:enoyl-CoA hydratase/isomerase family protein [Aspergillus flavus]
MSHNPKNNPVLAVVGVGPGIGEAVSRHFASKGFSVALIARTEDKLRKIQDSINESYPNSAKYYVTDVRDESSVIKTFDSIKEDLGPVHVLIYNAGSRRIRPRTILETSSEEFENFTRINMFGAFFAAKCVLPDMLAAGTGTIIFTGATGSIRGSPGLSSFSPGKFGLRALSQIITREFQSKGVHAAHLIVDGPVQSDIIRGWLRKKWEREGEEEKLKEMHRYVMQPSDLAEIYWFLYTQPRNISLRIVVMEETVRLATARMIPAPPPVDIPKSYETLLLTDVKVSHHPEGAPVATPVVVVTLNRPDKNNAFSTHLMDAFEKLFPLFDVDERVKVVVLTATGKIFCAGADLKEPYKPAKERPLDFRDPGGRMALSIYRCRKPTIAALQGSAVGIGIAVTLPCAIRIACEQAKYGFVFARRGLTLESCSSFFLPQTRPDPEQVLSHALELATKIAENVSLLAWHLNHALMWRNPGTAEGTHIVDSTVIYHMFDGRDMEEGTRSFLEKRKPHFTATLEDAPPNYPWWTEIDTGRRVRASKL